MGNSHKKHPQILVVEDNETVRCLMEIILKNEDHWHAIGVVDGETAIEVLQDGKFDLIIMDMMLPGIDGIETTKKIREFEKLSGRPRTPIIFFTAVEVNNICQECMAAGADDCIIKPTDMEDVVEKIYEYIPEFLR